ncbi:MAG: hypothetical protein ACTSXT_01355 [Candidatus Helarchaeota archaeon]
MKVREILSNLIDFYGDFYITKNNIRLSIRDNLHILFNDLNKGNKIIFNQNVVGVITGFADKTNRKYLKLIYNDVNKVGKILKILNWNFSEDLYIKIKKKNPIQKVLLYNGYKFKGGRGKELLFVRKYIRNREK